jgi:nucleoside-diphosphate-sugar epimerase
MKKTLVLGGNGYTGSCLVGHLDKKFGSGSVDSVDICAYGKDLGRSRHANLFDIGSLEGYGNVVLLAGHSSIAMCEADPIGSWHNNVDALRHVLQMLGNNQRLVLASSASVYPSGTVEAQESMCLPTKCRVEYDMQKMTVELLAGLAIGRGMEIVGLRMGTVNGPSPNTRSDLMMNSMVRLAMDEGVVRVVSPSVRRSILGIGDFCRAVERILASDRVVSGMYNLSSFSGDARQFGELCAERTGASLEMVEGVGVGFDFTLSTSLFSSNFGYEFTDTAEGVVSSLVEAHPDAVYGDRKSVHGIM